MLFVENSHSEEGKGGYASYVTKLFSRNSSQLTIRDSVSKSPLPVGHFPSDVCSCQIPLSNKFSHLDLVDAGAGEVSNGLPSAGILSPLPGG